MSAVHLLGIAIAGLDAVAVVDAIAKALARGVGGLVVTLNLNLLGIVRRDPDYRRIARGAELLVADGVPLLWLCRVRGTPLPGRVAGADLLPALCARAADDDRSVYLLGGSPGHAAAAAAALLRRHPGLRVVGTACPRPGFQHRPGEMEALRRDLVAARPDLVFVALGAPKQEYLAAQLRDDLPATWWMGVGGSFAFVAGLIPRAPRGMQVLGLEWLFRLGVEPRRLYRRYVIEDGPLFLRLLARAWRQRIADHRQRGKLCTMERRRQ